MAIFLTTFFSAPLSARDRKGTAADRDEQRQRLGWMGHADIKTTLIYAEYAPSARERGWV